MRKEKASFLCLLSDDCELDHRRMDNVINEFVENAPIKGIKIKYGIYKNIDKNLSIATYMIMHLWRQKQLWKIIIMTMRIIQMNWRRRDFITK